MRRTSLVALALVALVVGAVVLVALAPPARPALAAASFSTAQSKGWRPAGEAEEARVGPLGLVHVSQREWERRVQGVTLGEFHAIGVKTPVPLPSGLVVAFADEQVRALAARYDLALRPVEPRADPAGATVLEYAATPAVGSVFKGDVGVILRVMTCDATGNVALAAGFGVKDAATGPLRARLRVYDDEVRAILAPAVACP